MLVDSHCHILLLDDEIDVNDVLASAQEMDVGHMLCVSVDLDTFPQILELAREYEHISASAGLHPNSQVKQEPDVEELTELGNVPEVVAIGETGLDYYRSEGDLEWQRQRFRNHIQAAKSTYKPLIIHSRDAKGDVIRILQEEGAEEVGGVMHCFVDDWATAQLAMDLNFYISFSGIVTFKNAKQVQEVARQVPLERLLIETDSPYLAPVPYRGKPNQPAYVRHVAEFLAELRETEFKVIAQNTSDNFFRLFKNAHRFN